MKKSTLPAIPALVALCLCAPAFGQTPGQARTAHQDTEFLKTANQGSVDEIDLAKVALKKSDDPEVKNFAQMMIDDHTKLLDDMKPFDAEAGVSIPDHPSAGAEATRLKLDVLTGKTFDKAYIKDMVEDHHKVVEAFIKEDKSTGYPAFKDAVASGEKVVRHHLEVANGLAKKDGLPTAPVPASGV